MTNNVLVSLHALALAPTACGSDTAAVASFAGAAAAGVAL